MGEDVGNRLRRDFSHRRVLQTPLPPIILNKSPTCWGFFSSRHRRNQDRVAMAQDCCCRCGQRAGSSTTTGMAVAERSNSEHARPSIWR